MQTLEHQSGRQVLQEATHRVVKVGGEKACNIRDIVNMTLEGTADGTQKFYLVISAFRGSRKGGFNTTSTLNGIGDLLKKRDIEKALGCVDEIEQFTSDIVQREVRSDSALSIENQDRLLQELQALIRRRCVELRSRITLFQLQEIGEERLLQNDQEVYTLTGWGELLARDIYVRYLDYRKASSPSKKASVTSLKTEGTGQKTSDITETQSETIALNVVLHDVAATLRDALSKHEMIFVGPGYWETIAEIERGYSDEAAALTLQAVRQEVNGSLTTCVLLKDVPIYREGETVHQMTYDELEAAVQPGGFASGAVSAGAARRFRELKVSIVIGPANEETDDLTLVSARNSD